MKPFPKFSRANVHRLGTTYGLLTLLFIPCAALYAQVTNSVAHYIGYNEAYQKWGNNPPAELPAAAEQGDSNAMFAMFVANNTGYNSDPIVQPALEWLVKAAKAGHPEAQCYLGDNYENRMKFKDMAQAIHWYQLSAAQNHAGGEYHLALCYLGGKGVEQDEERGLQLLRQAADQGQWYSMAKLADVYARGIGVPRDENDRPISLLRRAADRGFVHACSDLVTRYEKGLGTDRDLIAAARWYCQGATLNSNWFPLVPKHPGAPTGVLKEVEPFDAALALFLRAITRHEPEAMVQIGKMYATGQEVSQDAASARQWFSLAAAQGSTNAALLVAASEKNMTPAELASAKASAERFANELAELSRKLPHE